MLGLNGFPSVAGVKGTLYDPREDLTIAPLQNQNSMSNAESSDDNR